MSKNWAIALFILVVIAAGWWWVVNYTPQSGQQAVQEQRIPPQDTHYTAPAKLEVTHTLVNGANVYSGTLPIRACNTFSGGLSASGTKPPHVQLTFTIFDGDGTCLASTQPENTPQPFSMSFSSKISTSTPVVDSVSINGTPVAFTIIEGK